jgi:hypothetical protein
MQTETCSKYSLRKLGSCLFNFGLMTGLTTLAFGLISCGGGGGGGNSTPATPTITSINSNGYSGMVASPSAQNISIQGTNFSNGMTLSISGTGITPINITNPTISSTGISGNATISSAPTDLFVTVDVKSSAGDVLVSTILGVASTAKTLATDIQPIFDSYCISCHGSNGGLDLRSTLVNGNMTSAINLLNTNSTACSQKLRVTPGDPRRASSVLIDKIKATPSSAACSGTPMPQTGSLTAQEIQDIVDWVAGGAN